MNEIIHWYDIKLEAVPVEGTPLTCDACVLSNKNHRNHPKRNNKLLSCYTHMEYIPNCTPEDDNRSTWVIYKSEDIKDGA
jgi:hypothetical protein